MMTDADKPNQVVGGNEVSPTVSSGSSALEYTITNEHLSRTQPELSNPDANPSWPHVVQPMEADQENPSSALSIHEERALSSVMIEQKTISKKRLCTGLVVLVGIIFLSGGAIAGIAAAVNSGRDKTASSPTSGKKNSALWDPETRRFEINSLLSSTALDPSSFLEPLSPQARALDFLVHRDTSLQSVDDESRLLQRYALITFAYALNADLWFLRTPWYDMPDAHECSFEGVDCDPQTMQVTGIQLKLNNLSGSIPDELGILTELTLLHLARNHLVGPIPDSVFQKLTKLEDLDLSLNKISSTLSESVGRLTNLKYLLLAMTNLSGDLPHSLKHLKKMEGIHLRDTRLHGPIFDFITRWSNLKHFDISGGLGFTGVIPSEIGKLTHLVDVLVAETMVNPFIPTEIGMLTNLEVLNVRPEGWPGGAYYTLPTELGNLKNLRNMLVVGRPYTGKIPSELGNLALLESLDLEQSAFTGEIPSELGNLQRLADLYLYLNMLEGTLPSEFANLSSLTDLRLQSNQLEGDIPKGLCQPSIQIQRDCALKCGCCIGYCE